MDENSTLVTPTIESELQYQNAVSLNSPMSTNFGHLTKEVVPSQYAGDELVPFPMNTSSSDTNLLPQVLTETYERSSSERLSPLSAAAEDLCSSSVTPANNQIEHPFTNQLESTERMFGSGNENSDPTIDNSDCQTTYVDAGVKTEKVDDLTQVSDLCLKTDDYIHEEKIIPGSITGAECLQESTSVPFVKCEIAAAAAAAATTTGTAAEEAFTAGMDTAFSTTHGEQLTPAPINEDQKTYSSTVVADETDVRSVQVEESSVVTGTDPNEDDSTQDEPNLVINEEQFTSVAEDSSHFAVKKEPENVIFEQQINSTVEEGISDSIMEATALIEKETTGVKCEQVVKTELNLASSAEIKREAEITQDMSPLVDTKPSVDDLDSIKTENEQMCIRHGCLNKAINNPEWEQEFCSNDCVILHCKNVFGAWVKSNAIRA